MEIDINQKKISIGDKYKIFVDGQQTHTASRKLFRWLTEIHLSKIGSNNPKYVIKRRWALSKLEFDLRNWNNNVFEFRTKNFWKLHFYCRVGHDYYEIFGHRGRKYSIYKNNVQIAYWDKEAVTLYKGDNYKIIADDDSDYELLISFCLIIDNKSSNNGDNNNALFSKTIDFGNIGPEAKEFNTMWKPK